MRDGRPWRSIIAALRLSDRGSAAANCVHPQRHPEWFDAILLLYEAHDLGCFGLEIAREFGIEAKCCFLMSVNDKEALDQVRDAVEFVYEVFGNADLVVTWGNDSVRPPLRDYPPIAID